jgi:N-methylhydantoinase A
VTATEIVTRRVRALARIAEIDWTSVERSAEHTDGAERQIWDGGWRTWRATRRDSLLPGDTLAPETIVEQEDTTVVIPAGWHGTVGAAGTLVLTREGA